MGSVTNGIRVSLNAQDVSEVRKNFDKLVQDLKDKANQPIDLNINESRLKDQLKQNVASIDEAVKKYKSLGEVSVSPKFDENGNLNNFKLKITEINGMVNELQYKVSGFKDAGNGKLEPASFKLSGLTEIDKRAEKVKELAQAEEVLLKAEQKLANQIANGRENIENKRTKEAEDLALQQQRQAGKITEQRLRKEQEYDDFWQKALFEQEQSEKGKTERIHQERLSKEQKYNDFWEKALKEKELKEIKSEENLANRIGSKNENTQINRKQDESKFDIKQAQAQNKVLEENYETILKLQIGVEGLKNKYGELINQTDFSKIENQMKNLSPKDSDSIEKATKDLKEYEQILQEVKRVASLGTKVIELPKDTNITENEQALKRYVQELYKGQKAYIDYSKSVDAAGKEHRAFKIEIDEGNNKIRQEKLVFDETTNSIYRNSDATKDLSKNTLTIGQRIQEAIRGFASFSLVMGTFYGMIRQVKEGIGVINDINKAQTDIQLITSMSRGEVQGLTKDYSNMASELKTTTTEIMTGASEFLRAGNNIKETQSLLKASTIGSAISGQSNQEMSQQLIAIANGFKMVTSDAKQTMSIIDTLSTLDNNSATSMSEISQALTRTASSAQNAGTNFQQLSTYIATVSSISRKSAESIGESFKTIFARLQNVKLKKALDDEGQVISDVEAVLKKFSINLRDTKNHFKDFPVIISELKPKWQEFTNNNDQLSKSMIANALAGTRQRENFLLLMDNLSTVEDLTKKVANANGDAERKFDSAYKDSTKARIAEFKNEVQKLWQTLLSSDVINGFISVGTKAVKVLQDFINMSTISKVAIFAWGAAIVTTIKVIKTFVIESTKMGQAIKLSDVLIKALIPSLAGATNATVGFSAAMSGLKTAMLFLFTTPQGWAILGIASALAIATAAMQHHSKVQQKLKEDAQNLTTAYQSLNESIKNLETIKANDDRLKQMEDKVGKAIDLKNQLVEVERKLAEAQKAKENHEDQPQDYRELIQQQKDLTQAIAEQDVIMKKAGVSIDDYNSLKEKIDNVNIANTIKEQTKAEYEQKDAITSLWNEYQQLNSIESKNADVKSRMTQIANELKDKIGANTVAVDKNGNVVLENTSLVGQNVAMLNKEGMTIESLTQKRLNDMKQNRMVQANMTSDTYANVKARVAMMKEEMGIATKDMDALTNKWKNGTITDDERLKLDTMTRYAMSRSSSIANFEDVLGEIDKIYSVPSGLTSSYNIDTEGDGYDAYYKDKEKKSPSEQIQNIDLKIDKYNEEKQAIINIEKELTRNKSIEESLYGDTLTSKKKEDINLLQQKSSWLDKLHDKQVTDRNAAGSLLKQFGFDVQGENITNYISKMKEWTDIANNTNSSVEARKSAQEHAKNLEEQVKLFYSLNKEITENRTQWQQLQQEAEKVKLEIIDINLNLKLDNLKPLLETSKDLNSQINFLESNENEAMSSQISKSRQKLSLNQQLLKNSESEKTIYQSNIDYLQEQLKDTTLTSKARQDILNKLSQEKDKLRSNTEEIKKQNDLIKDTIADIAAKQLSYSMYGGKTEEEYERIQNNIIENKNAEIEALQKKWELEKESEERQEKLLEIQKLRNKLNTLQNIDISKVTEEEAKRLGVEEERTKILEHNKELLELELKLKNLQTQKNIQTLTQKDGKWQFEYIADQKEISKIKDDIKKKQDDFNKWNKSENNKLKDELKKSEETYAKWEIENAHRKQIELLQGEVKHLEKDLELKKQFIEKTKKLLRESLDKENPDSLTSIVNTAMKDMTDNTKTKFADIITSIQSGVNGAKSEIESLISKINSIPAIPITSFGGSSGNSNKLSGNNNTSITSNSDDMFNQFNGNLEHDKAIYDKIKGLKVGGYTHEDGVAKLHKNELILDKVDTGKIINADKILQSTRISKDLFDNISSLIKPLVEIPGSIINNVSRINIQGLDIPSSITKNNANNYNIDKISLELPNITDSSTAADAINSLENGFATLSNRIHQRFSIPE